MSKMNLLVCDGCGDNVESGTRPADWRHLRVTNSRGTQFLFDVCSPRCASKAVDRTYEDDDRAKLLPFLR